MKSVDGVELGAMSAVWVIGIVSNGFTGTQAIVRPGIFVVGNEDGCVYIPQYFPDKVEIAESGNVYSTQESADKATEEYNKDKRHKF